MIPNPTQADLARDAEADYHWMVDRLLRGAGSGEIVAAAWIRRAVAAERERDELRKAILAFGNNPAGFDWAVIGKIDEQEQRIAELESANARLTEELNIERSWRAKVSGYSGGQT